MKKDIVQRVVFIIAAICAFFTPILDMLPWSKFTLLSVAIIYLALGWYFPMIRDNNSVIANALAGIVYTVVFLGNFMETSGIPIGIVFVYLGYAMAVALMIYMLFKRKTVRKDMVIQSIILFYLAPVPLFI